MAGTFPLPQQSYDPAHGPYLFGPQSVAPNDSLIVLTIDRTVAGGLNSLTSATSAEIKAEQSSDGGTTWFLAVAADVPGGQYFRTGPHGDGSLITTSSVTVNVYGSGPGRQLRATITVSGPSPVVLAGSLAVS